MFSPGWWQNKTLAAAHPSADSPVGNVCLICCQTQWPQLRCCRNPCFRHMVPSILTADLTTLLFCTSICTLWFATCFHDLILEYF